MNQQSKDSNDDIEDVETLNFVIAEEFSGIRIDKVLNDMDEKLSRSRIRSLIEDGQLLLNGEVCDNPSKKVKVGDAIEIDIPPPVAAYPQAENIPLDIVYEDDDLIVLNKSAGLVVHPGAGNPAGTLVNALLYHCGDSLSGINGVLRPGIVHRLDKDTSGLMLVAKNDSAHRGLAAQLEDRSLSRVYKALVLKAPFPLRGTIDQPIGRHHINRREMMVTTRHAKEAVTHYEVLESLGNGACGLVACKLESGRTHQIRVHMSWLKHPVLGDPVYGAQANAVTSVLKKGGYTQKVIDKVLEFPRQALHAGHIAFIHPGDGEEMEFEAELPKDMAKLLKLLQ